jgi:hypothetical protein
MEEFSCSIVQYEPLSKKLRSHGHQGRFEGLGFWPPNCCCDRTVPATIVLDTRVILVTVSPPGANISPICAWLRPTRFGTFTRGVLGDVVVEEFAVADTGGGPATREVVWPESMTTPTSTAMTRAAATTTIAVLRNVHFRFITQKSLRSVLWDDEPQLEHASGPQWVARRAEVPCHQEVLNRSTPTRITAGATRCPSPRAYRRPLAAERAAETGDELSVQLDRRCFAFLCNRLRHSGVL